LYKAKPVLFTPAFFINKLLIASSLLTTSSLKLGVLPHDSNLLRLKIQNWPLLLPQPGQRLDVSAYLICENL